MISDTIRPRCSCIACVSSVLLPVLETQGKDLPAFLDDDGKQPSVDLEAFVRGQVFFRQNLFSIFVAHFVGLINLLRVESILKVLMMTGKSETPQKSFKRYFNTILHLKHFYETDIWDTNKRGAESLREVRRKHMKSKSIAKTLLSHRISQKDMVLTHWAFVSPIVLQPHKLGINSSAQIQDFVYFWKIIGCLLGIHDRFNLCQGSLEDVQRECLAILHQIMQPSIKRPPKHFDYMARTMVEGLTKFLPMLESQSFISYASYLLDVPVLCHDSKWQYSLKIWILERGFHIPILGVMLRNVLNFLLRLSIFANVMEQKLRNQHYFEALKVKNTWHFTKETLSNFTNLLIINLRIRQNK